MQPTSVTPNPFDSLPPDKIEEMFQRLSELPPSIREILIEAHATTRALNKILTSDPQMLLLKENCKLLATRSEPVLILGESGTGKSLVAHAIHGSRKGRFIQINCSSLPSELIASELFGHLPGAFTGAIAKRIGKLQAAVDGTVFLDEIGDMPMDMQAMLLNALEEHIITPVGSNDSVNINCRIVCATNKNIEQMIKDKLFREDLYYRINRAVLTTTPLRDRWQDAIMILDSKYDPTHLLPRTQSHYDELRGNYRELETLVFQQTVMKHK